MWSFWGLLIAALLFALSFVIVPLFSPALQAISYNASSRESRVLATILLLFITLAAVFFYQRYGASQQVIDRLAINEMQAKLGSPALVMKQLEQHLKQNPQSAEGWYLLGRLYLSDEQMLKGKNALAKAYHLEPNNTTYQLRYAESLLLTQQVNQAEKLIKNILHEQPDNVQALNLLAFGAFEHHNYREALADWKKLLEQYPLSREDRQAIEKAMQAAEQALKVR